MISVAGEQNTDIGIQDHIVKLPIIVQPLIAIFLRIKTNIR